MKVLEIILPVLVMILLGMACKRLKLLDQNGINNMKLLVTQIMLPVAIFHALATADYNKETGILVGIMFVMLVVSFSIGFLLRPLMPGRALPEISALYGQCIRRRFHGLSFIYQPLRSGEPFPDR